MTIDDNGSVTGKIASDNTPSRELTATIEPADTNAEQWHKLKGLVLDGVTSAHSRRSYNAAMEGFVEWWESACKPPFRKATVQAFRAKLEREGLAPATINVRLAAIRKLAVEAADNGLLDPDVAAGIGRVSCFQQDRVFGPYGQRTSPLIALHANRPSSQVSDSQAVRVF